MLLGNYWQRARKIMADYLAAHILDLLNIVEEEESLTQLLMRFSSPQNAEIENFIHCKSVEFAQKKLSMTHLVFDNSDGNFVGFFTLTHKSIFVKRGVLSKTAIRSISKYARYNEDVGAYILSAFLVAQLGKNYALDASERISGNELVSLAFNTLADVQRQIGGGVVFLECEDNQKLLDFYTQSPNLFRKFGERLSETDGTKYIQLLRFI